MDRTRAGQRVEFSARRQNVLEEAAEAVLSRSLYTGQPTARPERWTDVITIRNDTGAAREAGDVVQIDGPIGSEPEPPRPTYKGILPKVVPTDVGGMPYRYTVPLAVLLDGADTSGFCPAQVSGLCVAKVNVGNAAHRWADADETGGICRMVSGYEGRFEIIHKPTGTGEKLCTILLSKAVPNLAGRYSMGGVLSPAFSPVTFYGPWDAGAPEHPGWTRVLSGGTYRLQCVRAGWYPIVWTVQQQPYSWAGYEDYKLTNWATCFFRVGTSASSFRGTVGSACIAWLPDVVLPPAGVTQSAAGTSLIFVGKNDYLTASLQWSTYASDAVEWNNTWAVEILHRLSMP